MRKVPRLTDEATDELWDDPAYEPGRDHLIDSLNLEVDAALDLLARLHQEAAALVQMITAINERVSHPALEYWRSVDTSSSH
jgi:hypothetical protein